MGADGARGGDVVFVASPRVTTLDHVTTTVRAGRGGHGQGRGCLGKTGTPAIVEVPCGTMVWFDNRATRSKGESAAAAPAAAVVVVAVVERLEKESGGLWW